MLNFYIKWFKMHYFEYAIRELPRLSNIYARQFARFHAQMEI